MSSERPRCVLRPRGRSHATGVVGSSPQAEYSV